MIDFSGFVPTDGTPIYQQIVLHIKRGIIAGTVMDGDELPSRRVLSALLGVNPNTVQKACHILEEEGLIRSQTGAKSVVVLDDGAKTRVRRELLEGDARIIVSALRQMGLTKSDAVELIERFWNDDDKGEVTRE